MILHRPLRRLGLFVALLAQVTAGRAENTAHAPAAVNPAPSPDSPAEQVAALAPGDSSPDKPVDGNAARFEIKKPVAAKTVDVAAPGAVTGGTADTALIADLARKQMKGLLVLGASLTERSDWDAAEIAYRQILSSRQANADELAAALIGTARVYRRQGSLTKAAAIYERYLKDYPGDDQVPDALLELGRTHRALGAPQLALSRFYSVINSTLKLSGEGSAHYQTLAKTAQFEIAETHFQLGEFTEANKYFSRLRLLDLAPADRARAHFKSAYALFLNNDFAGAVSTLHSYLDQWPLDENVPEARYLLSLSLRSLGRKQEALDATLALLRTEKTSDPKRWGYWQRRTGNQLANDFFQNGDTMNALAIYQGLAVLTPEPEWRLPITYQIGLCYERMRLTERASAAYQTIIDYVAQPADPKASDETKPGEAQAARPVSAELTELARMATWRQGQLAWHDQTEKQLSGIFSTKQEFAQKAPPAVHSAAPNLDGNAASQSITPSSVHDTTGNPAATPPSL